MKNSSFDMNEFMNNEETPVEANVEASAEAEEQAEAPELDVQKAVVESLAADKAELNSKLEAIKAELAAKNTELEGVKSGLEAKEAEIVSLKEQLASKNAEIEANKAEIASKNAEIARKDAEIAQNLEKEFDMQERNPNALALLDRDVDIPDRFPGETRDHVLEVVKEAREAADKEGRIRRAQVLEGVLVANEPNGNLAKKRESMEKLFNDNGNIVNGTVIEELKNLGITHKNGEEYLLPSEIIKRNY